MGPARGPGPALGFVASALPLFASWTSIRAGFGVVVLASLTLIEIVVFDPGLAPKMVLVPSFWLLVEAMACSALSTFLTTAGSTNPPGGGGGILVAVAAAVAAEGPPAAILTPTAGSGTTGLAEVAATEAELSTRPGEPNVVELLAEEASARPPPTAGTLDGPTAPVAAPPNSADVETAPAPPDAAVAAEATAGATAGKTTGVVATEVAEFATPTLKSVAVAVVVVAPAAAAAAAVELDETEAAAGAPISPLLISLPAVAATELADAPPPVAVTADTPDAGNDVIGVLAAGTALTAEAAEPEAPVATTAALGAAAGAANVFVAAAEAAIDPLVAAVVPPLLEAELA